MHWETLMMVMVMMIMIMIKPFSMWPISVHQVGMIQSAFWPIWRKHGACLLGVKQVGAHNNCGARTNLSTHCCQFTTFTSLQFSDPKSLLSTGCHGFIQNWASWISQLSISRNSLEEVDSSEEECNQSWARREAMQDHQGSQPAGYPKTPAPSPDGANEH